MNLQPSSTARVLVLGAALGLFYGCASRCGYPVQHFRTLSVADVPPTVLIAFDKTFPGSTVQWIGVLGSGTNKAYSFQFTQAGKPLAVIVGTLGDVGPAYKPTPANASR